MHGSADDPRAAPDSGPAATLPGYGWPTLAGVVCVARMGAKPNPGQVVDPREAFIARPPDSCAYGSPVLSISYPSSPPSPHVGGKTPRSMKRWIDECGQSTGLVTCPCFTGL